MKAKIEYTFATKAYENIKPTIEVEIPDMNLMEAYSYFEDMFSILKEKEQEYQRGYSEGENAGKQSEQERLQELKDNISNTIKEIIDYRKQIIKEAETTIVTLALNFAKNKLGEEIHTNREIIQNQVKKSLEYIIGEGKLIFHVHPDDESQFDDKDQFIPKEYLGAIEIVTDENITRGGCLLETNSGTIDSTIEAKIDELGKSIKIGLEQDLNE